MSLVEDATVPQLAHRTALRNALVFAAAGVAWVLVTDSLLLALVEGDWVARISIFKGWAFISVAAVFVYVLTRSTLERLQGSEATMRAILKGAFDGILLVGKDGRISYANPRALEMLGAESREEVLGLDASGFASRFRLTAPDGSAIAPADYPSHRALKGEVSGAFKAILHPPGRSPLTVTLTAAPIRIDPDGDVELAVAVIRDVTELEALDRLRDEFFAAAAHSLKTPVTVIKTHAQLLSSHATTRSELTSAVAIDRQCGRMDRLVQNLMVLSRFQSGTMLLQPKPVDVCSLAERISASIRKSAPERLLRERCGESVMVLADPERLALVIHNLVERAYSISPPGSEVEVLLDEENGHVRLGVQCRPSVSLEQENATSAAERFTGGESHRYLGLDVGTHVSEKLIEAHGGALRVETTSGLRTTWIDLPRLEEPASAGT